MDPRSLRKITEVLWPPNPKVLLRAAFTVRFWALLKVKFSFGSISGSSVKWLIVGGTVSWCTAMMLATASMAPAAPSRCPVMLLVELMFSP